MRGLSPVAASGGHSSSRCTGLSLSRPHLLRSTGSRLAGSVIVAHRPSCSAACGILPDQGPNPRPPHCQADSQPLRHQGSPQVSFRMDLIKCRHASIHDSCVQSFLLPLPTSLLGLYEQFTVLNYAFPSSKSSFLPMGHLENPLHFSKLNLHIMSFVRSSF